MAKGNPDSGAVTGTQSPGQAVAGLSRIRAVAREDKGLRFTNLMHHIDVPTLRRAYWALKRNAAPGVDRESWQDYGQRLNERLYALHERVQSGRYRPQPVARVWIPKADGRQRPLGVSCVEDKVLQQALTWVLESIYEVDFKGFSYGFRPGRHQHQALDAVYVAITQKKVSWVLDADIQRFFDRVDHGWLMKFLAHRIGDRRILRLVERTLKAGVVEEGQRRPSNAGTPQGAVLSPLLANIYLHYSLDLWVAAWRRRYARGEVYVVRYADDVVLGFQYRSDAQHLRRALEQRLARFALTLHPDKTRVVEFGRFAQGNRAKRGAGKPETFDFLGFTHACARRPSDGGFSVRRRSMAKRLRELVHELKDWLRTNRHLPLAVQGQYLRRVLQGYANYFGVPGNRDALETLRTQTCRHWFRALRRRSQKARRLTWAKFNIHVRCWIPTMRITHPYPNQRLRV